MLCLDWGERSLRVIEASVGRGGVNVRRAVHVPLAQGVNAHDPAAMGEFIRQTLAEHRIRAKRAVIDIPRQDVALHLLTLPTGTMDELSAMVHIQIAKELPFSKEQAVVDFAISRTDEAGTSHDVWVAAVRNAVVDRYRQTLNAAGLRMERIGLRPYANLAAVIQGPVAEGRTMHVDVGTTMTEINVIRDGLLVFSRTAAVPVPPEGLLKKSEPTPKDKAAGISDSTIPLADDFVTRPGPMETLQLEVSRTIQAYRAIDPGANIDRIVLSGTVGFSAEIVSSFANRFATKTSLFELPDSIQWSQDVSPVSFCATIGLALGHRAEHGKRFDFLHPKEPEAERRQRVKRRPIIAAGIGILVLAAGAVAYRPIHNKNAAIDKIEGEIKQLNKNKDEREDFLKQLKEVETWKERNVAWIDQLALLTEAFPDNKQAYITGLVFAANKGEITISLVAIDKKVGTGLADKINAIKGPKGKELFVATTGNTEENPKDPKYKWEDTVTVQVKSLITEKRR